MTIVKGIKKGKTIELLEDVNVPDGQEVLVNLQSSDTSSLFTITEENQAFLAKISPEKRSAYINALLDQSRQKEREEDIVIANIEEGEEALYGFSRIPRS